MQYSDLDDSLKQPYQKVDANSFGERIIEELVNIRTGE